MTLFDKPSIQGSDMFGYRCFPDRQDMAFSLKAKTQKEAIKEAAYALECNISEVGIQCWSEEQGYYLVF